MQVVKNGKMKKEEYQSKGRGLGVGVTSREGGLYINSVDVQVPPLWYVRLVVQGPCEMRRESTVYLRG